MWRALLFAALQALDIDVVNAGHDGIAALAAAGALKAVVTTSFDRLIERDLDQRGVPYRVAYDDTGFTEMSEVFRSGRVQPLPIIKIHGCVSAHLSMIDTLKQRKADAHITCKPASMRCKRAIGCTSDSRPLTLKETRITLAWLPGQHSALEPPM